jgi:hypothetical protein
MGWGWDLLVSGGSDLSAALISTITAGMDRSMTTCKV